MLPGSAFRALRAQPALAAPFALLLFAAALLVAAAAPAPAETNCRRAVVSARQFGASTSEGGNQLLGARDRAGRLVRITLADGQVIRGVQSSSDTTFWGNFSVGRSVEVCRVASRVVAAAASAGSASGGSQAQGGRRVIVVRVTDRTTGASLTGIAEPAAAAGPGAAATPRPLDRP